MAKKKPGDDLAILLEVLLEMSSVDKLFEGLKAYQLADLRTRIDAVYPARAGQEKLALLENVDSMLRERKLTFDALYRSVHSTKPSTFAKLVLDMIGEYHYEFDDLFANQISRWKRTVAGKEYQRALEKAKEKAEAKVTGDMGGAKDKPGKIAKRERKRTPVSGGIRLHLPTDIK